MNTMIQSSELGGAPATDGNVSESPITTKSTVEKSAPGPRPHMHVVWDADFRVIRWSRHAQRVFGWKASEVVGLHPREWNFLHEDDQAQAERVMKQLRTGAAKRFIARLRHYRQNGADICCDWYHYAVEGGDAGPSRIESLVRKIEP